MTFDHPFLLFGFAVFIPMVILDLLGNKNKLSQELQKKFRANVYLFRLFVFFAIIALAGPRWGMGFAPSEYRRGVDTVFAIDISRSMDIRDAQIGTRVTQSRLERGLFIAKESIASVSGARFAAAIGRGSGYLAVPLTYDNEAALVFLESIDVSSMTGRSTNLESLVDAAVGAFQSTSVARKVIVLISDGEALSGVLRNAINRCVKEGIIVNTVAVGSDEGRQILSQSEDPQSPSVTSRREVLVMRTVAERTGGIYIDGGREDAHSVLSSHLLSVATDIESANGKKTPKQRRSLFVILAIVAYSASKFITRQSQKLPLSRLFTAGIITVTLIFTSCSEGKLLLIEANYLFSRGRYDEALIPYLKALNHKEAAPYAEYGLGLTFYSLDEGEAGLKRYQNSQRMLGAFSENEHRELHYRNHYNSGIIHFENRDFRAAAYEFREALRADPRKIDAKRNLELSLMSISMESDTEKRTEAQEEQREILFEYLRQEEEQRWKSREWAPEENNTGADY
ncbi:MAG: VWA domain-containing protein [Treponema sp.]|jgi:Ca-activated chloride channel family protein|nr:VWA domain-containing protein [Treponema sp.]